MVDWALVIDDDRDNRELLAELLEAAGYPVISCGSAAAADGVLDQKGRPGVVVSDIRLPDMPGTTFVSNMRRRPGFEGTPVIFVTGLQPSPPDAVSDPVLIKPFDLDVLMGLVEEAARKAPPQPPGAVPG